MHNDKDKEKGGDILTEELLKNKKLNELREIAKAYDIPKYYKYKKAELIDVIINSLDKPRNYNDSEEELEKKDKKLDISSIDMDDLSDKATEEI